MKKTLQKIGAGIATAVVALSSIAMPALAAPPPSAFTLEPFTFVGTAEQCGGVAGTNIITAMWDSSTGNSEPSILLEKQGLTSDCSAAGVDVITSLEGGPLSAITELNFDYKDGGHCGAGAPRFNVQTDQGTAFLGCSGGTQTSLGNGWTHVVFTGAQLTTAYTAAGISSPATATLQDLYIIFDEGTDTPAGGTIGTPGAVNIDNISVNNAVVGSPTKDQMKNSCKKGGYLLYTGENDTPGPFKNQGQCVSYFAKLK